MLSNVEKLLKSNTKNCPSCKIDLLVNTSRYFFKDSNGIEIKPKYIENWLECSKCGREFILFTYLDQGESIIINSILVLVLKKDTIKF
ncbi:MAG: hypothetical protein ACFFDB_00260 [Promethearchaeota archaeon]